MSRDPWLDNAKMLLVTLVVVGHTWALLSFSPGMHDDLYNFLYLWHMPAFVMVTGYLSQRFTYSRQRVWGLVRGLLVPYVLVEAALAAFRADLGGEGPFHHLWISPHWPLWYLPAVFCWRLLTPALRRLGLAALPVAVGISLVGGYIDWDYLALRRILGFLPFFTIGLLATPGAINRLRAVPRMLPLAVLGGAAVAMVTLPDWAQTRWLYYSWTYAHLDSVLPTLLTRGLLLAGGTAAALAVLALIPGRMTWFTRMGSMSLVVYLCHGFVIKAISYTGVPAWADAHGALGLAVTAAGAVCVALLLASAPVATVLQRAIDPLTYAEQRFDTARDLQFRSVQLTRARRTGAKGGYERVPA